MDIEDGQLLLTIEQAARVLAVGRSTMYTLVKDGRVPAVKFGRNRRIPRSGLEAFVAGLYSPQ